MPRVALMEKTMIDVNVYLSRWPTRRLACDETPKLVAKLQQMSVRQAWVGSFDGLLHKDVAAVNTRLVEECNKFGEGMLVPFGTVNPMLPDWREDVRRCHEEHKMPGIRLHPNYHRYKLDLPEFTELLAMADERGLIVQLAVKMEDERTQHPALQVEAVETEPLLQLIEKTSNLQLVLLNSLRTLRGQEINRLSQSGNIYFDIAMQESVGGITHLLKNAPLDRVLFGSYFPFFYFESATLKLKESALANFQTTAIERNNAKQIRSQAGR